MQIDMKKEACYLKKCLYCISTLLLLFFSPQRIDVNGLLTKFSDSESL